MPYLSKTIPRVKFLSLPRRSRANDWQMLWNWYTVDACFLAESWHIESEGMFAASCVGVAFLVVMLEFLRRLGKEYDSHMYQQFQRRATLAFSNRGDPATPCIQQPTFVTFRPTPLQQLIRSVIHMASFAVAYLIMLLAMYFNGYIIISIFIGALVGKFLCDWDSVTIAVGGSGSGEDGSSKGKDLTYCCG